MREPAAGEHFRQRQLTAKKKRERGNTRDLMSRALSDRVSQARSWTLFCRRATVILTGTPEEGVVNVHGRV